MLEFISLRMEGVGLAVSCSYVCIIDNPAFRNNKKGRKRVGRLMYLVTSCVGTAFQKHVTERQKEEVTQDEEEEVSSY